MRKQSSSLYEIRDPADDKLKLVATREMNRYHLGPDEDVRDTIAMDEFENLVEEVVDHRKIGNSTSVRDFDFRVRWTGLGPEEDTWHPEVERRFYGWKLAKTPPKPMDKFVFVQTIAIVGQWSRDRIVARRGYLPRFMDFV